MRTVGFGRWSIPALVGVIRFALVITVLVSGMAWLARPAVAATAAEQFVAENVQRGLGILNDKQISKDERRTKFREFLLGLTDIKLIAEYTLGQYRRSATPDELSAYDSAFKEYALSVYQSYFAKYTGQTLQVTGSYSAAPDETIVKTVMVDQDKSSAKPLEVNFRLLNKGGKLVVIDFSVEGVWIRELERNDFTSYLGQNDGNVAQLTSSLKAKSQQMR